MTHCDIRKLMDCIRDIYANLDIKCMPAHIVFTVSRIIPSSIVMYARYSYGKNVGNQGAVCVEEAASVGSFEQIEAFERHAHEHPFINMLCSQKERARPFSEDELARRKRRHDRGQPKELAAVKISDVLDDRQFHSLALFNEFFRPNRIRYQLGIPVSSGEGSHTAVCFNRDKRDFSEDERMMLNLVGPHIAQAYRNAQSYAKARDATGVINRLSEDKDFGLLISLGLSPREAEVLWWVTQGKTNHEIAMILNIAPGTVKIHLEKIYRKLGVESRMAAAKVAMERSLIQMMQGASGISTGSFLSPGEKK